MSILDRFRRAAAKSTAQWIAAYVTNSDTLDRRSSINVDQAALVARAHGWVFRAAAQNARSTVCNNPLRMYTPAGNKAASKLYGTRSLTRSRRLWINKRGPINMGAKAVQYAELAGEVEEVIDHPALRLLRFGNDYMSGLELLELTCLFRELAGNAYHHVAIEGGEPVALWPLMPQHTFIIADERDFIRHYISGRQGHLVHTFQPDEVIHYKHMQSPVEPFYGYSWLRAAVYAADIYTSSRIHEKAVWDNGARPDYAVMLKGSNYTTEQAERMRRQLTSKHGGPEKAGQPVVMAANDIEIKPLGFTPREMEYIEGLGSVRDEIMALADIPKSLYTSDDVNLANAEVGNRLYAEQAILPRLTKLADTLTDQLLPYYGIEPGEMWFGFDNPVPEDEAQQLERRGRMQLQGVMTVNEWRAEDGLDPLEDPAADKLLFQGQPLAQAGVGTLGGLSGAFGEGAPQEASEAVTEAPRGNPLDRDWVSSIVTQVSSGALPGESAVRMLTLYASMDEADARALVEPAEATSVENREREDAATETEPDPDKAGVEGRAEIEGKDADRDGRGGRADGSTGRSGEPVGGGHADGAGDGQPAAGAKDAGGGDAAAECGHGAGCGDGQDAERLAHLAKMWTRKDILRASPFTDSPEDAFIRELLAWFRRFSDAAAANAGPGFRIDMAPYKKGKGAKQFREDWVMALVDILKRNTVDFILRGASEAAVAMQAQGLTGGVGISFDVQNPVVQAFLAERDTLLLRAAGSITETTEEIVRGAISRSMGRGESVQQVAERVQTAMADTSADRAILIARTETAQAQVEGERAQWAQFQEETGERIGKVWLLAHDACEICQAIAAKHGDTPIPLDIPFAKIGETVVGGGKSLTVKIRDVQGAPLHPNCVLEGTHVLARGVVAGIRAFYRGEVVHLRMADGRWLGVTPNHMLLTPSGFVAAESIREGDDVLDCGALDRVVARHPDDDLRPARIEDVVRSLAVSGGVAASSVPVSPEYLHGDARLCEGDIDVVASDGLLWDALEAMRLKGLDHLPLCAGWDGDRLAGLGDLDAMLVGMSLAARGFVAGRGPSKTLGGRCLRHAGVHGLGSVALSDADLLERDDNGGSGYADALGECFDRFPGLVSASKVVGVETALYSGHVYDLQSESGLYIANGLVSSNCRCSLQMRPMP